MANICINSFAVSNDDQEALVKFYKAFMDGNVFKTFFPMPEQLEGTICPSPPNEVYLSLYGASNWCDWKEKNWGIKCDIGINEECSDYSGGCRINGNICSGVFGTPWSPPIEAFKKLAEFGFKFYLNYEESGNGFLGVLSWDGESLVDDCYDIDFDEWEEDGVDWREFIPEEFHDMIEERYDEWLEDKYCDEENED